MKYIRGLNNNAAIAADDNGKDIVIFGKGISFTYKRGDTVPDSAVERVFQQKDATVLGQLLENIPQEYFNLSCEIIQYIQVNLQLSLNNSLYIALMDHISFVKERADKGMLPKNSLKWEIRRYYPKEFHLGERVVSLLEDEFDCKLNDDEAASIALHVINAENDGRHVRESMDIVKMVDDILQIICFQAGVEPDESDLNYQRLVTHVKFFIQRVRQKKAYEVEDDLHLMIQKSYPQAYRIADKVRVFMEKQMNCKISGEEVTYLAVHTQHILKN